MYSSFTKGRGWTFRVRGLCSHAEDISANCYVLTNSTATPRESCSLLSCVQCGILKTLKIPLTLTLRFLLFKIQVRTCLLNAYIYVLSQHPSISGAPLKYINNFCVVTFPLSPLLPPTPLPPSPPPSVSSSSSLPLFIFLFHHDHYAIWYRISQRKMDFGGKKSYFEPWPC